MNNDTSAGGTRVGTCVIFGAGEYYAGAGSLPQVPDGALVIAADGGLDHARSLDIPVDVVVGDFDSIVDAHPLDGEQSIVLPPQKDDPDMLSALKIGWSRGCRVFHIYGGLGGRVDHTLANIQLMALLAARGGIGLLHGDGTVVTAICDGALSFPADHGVAPGRMVSVFAHSDICEDVNEPGLKYELRHGTLTNTMALGVSNELLPGVAGAIGVRRGTLIVTFPAEAPMPVVTRFHEFDGDLGPLDTQVSSLLSDRLQTRRPSLP